MICLRLFAGALTSIEALPIEMPMEGEGELTDIVCEYPVSGKMTNRINMGKSNTSVLGTLQADGSLPGREILITFNKRVTNRLCLTHSGHFSTHRTQGGGQTLPIDHSVNRYPSIMPRYLFSTLNTPKFIVSDKK